MLRDDPTMPFPSRPPAAPPTPTAGAGIGTASAARRRAYAVPKPVQPPAPSRIDRVRARLVDAAAVLSLVLMLATAAAWASGERWPAAWARLPGSTAARAQFVAARGGCAYFISQQASQSPDGSWSAEVTAPGRTVVRSGARPPTKLFVNFLRPSRTMLWFDFDRSPGVPMKFVTPSGAAGTCTTTYQVTSMPPWAVIGALAFVPAARWRRSALRRLRRRARAARGLCSACGYDLSGNTSGVCPECGTPTRTA